MPQPRNFGRGLLNCQALPPRVRCQQEAEAAAVEFSDDFRPMRPNIPSMSASEEAPASGLVLVTRDLQRMVYSLSARHSAHGVTARLSI
jgi:hypothetical protein